MNEQTNKLYRDRHFIPSYDQCKPCTYQYDIFGKMETFAADTSLVVAQLGHNLSQSTLDSWSRESELDAIVDSIRSPYGWRMYIMKCMSWEEANQRIWRKLQIRGLLDKKESPPMATFHQWSRSPDAFIGVNIFVLFFFAFRLTYLVWIEKEFLSMASILACRCFTLL